MNNTKKKKVYGYLRTFLIGFIALVFGWGVYSWNARSLVGNQLPMPFGYGISIVLSGSMEPALSVDDLVIIQQSQDYQMGDIVVYQSADVLVIHRIVDMDTDSVLTQGDANPIADEPILKEAIKGKLLLSIPKVGAVVKVLKSPAGMIVLLAGAVILLEFSYSSEKKKDQEDLEKIKEEIRKLKGGNI